MHQTTFERDYIYVNKRDGTSGTAHGYDAFHTRFMGADMADINNDAHPEIFCRDMVPEHTTVENKNHDNWDINHVIRISSSVNEHAPAEQHRRHFQ
jgi:hypothetical protein